jgi:glycosyltransferase involved in cell wall biosynthesis
LQRKLLGPECIALIAMSEYARRQCLHQNRNFSGRSALEAKLRVVHPAVSARRASPKTGSGEIKLLFVGTDFMRKGLPALLRAHARLRERGLPVETVVISSLAWSPDDYIGPASQEYVSRELRRLDQPGLVHHSGLPNSAVLELMTSADFLVFPTFHETFGYVSLEALACGTPVIVTATCAQPELVEHGRNGFLLPFENEPRIGKWVWTYRNRDPGYLDAYEHAVGALATAIEETICRFWEDRGGYEALSAAALQSVRDRFDRAKTALILEALYERCRSGPTASGA